MTGGPGCAATGRGHHGHRNADDRAAADIAAALIAFDLAGTFVFVLSGATAGVRVPSFAAALRGWQLPIARVPTRTDQ